VIVLNAEVEANRQYQREYDARRREEKKQYLREWRAKRDADPERRAAHLEYHRRRQLRTASDERAAESLREANRRSYRKNKKRRISATAEYKRRRSKSDAKFNLLLRLRARASKILKADGLPARSCAGLFGCSRDHLFSHIESQFTDGMNWENRRLWHIDHIYPVSRIDVTSELDISAAFNWRNLRPMWAADNLRKNAKVTPESADAFESIKKILSTPEETVS